MVPFDSYSSIITKVLINSYSSFSSRQNLPITHDLFECIQGRSDSDPTRGYRCHYFAYQSYPATVYTDFYTKQCGGVVEIHLINLGSYYYPNYVTVLNGVESGYTIGTYNSTGVYSTDFERWVSTQLNTLPEIECGPRIDGYHHMTRIEQNRTHTYSDTYLFGPDQGMHSSGDFLQEVHGNVTLNSSDHDVLFEGTGTFDEVADLRRTTTTTSTATVEVEFTRSGTWGSLRLEAPDGQQYRVCYGACGSNSIVYHEYEVRRETISFNTTDPAGDWTLLGQTYRTSHTQATINSWALGFGHVGTESILDSPHTIHTSSYTPIDTIPVPHGPQLRYNGDLYLMAVGVNATETVMIRSTDYVSPSLLSISNLPSYVPYEITHGNFTLKTGMTDNSGRIEIQHSEVAIELTEPITLKYWPNSLTYVGNYHANGKSIMFDTYHDRVIPFPWDPNDPLLYIAKAYVRMTIPVDGMSLDGIRLYNKAGQHVSYSHLTGTYNSGDEVYVPVFVGANEIHLKINGDWVQSYIKDVQQNTRALVFGGTGSIEGVELSESATIFATTSGEVVALVSATVSGSGHYYYYADYSGGRYTNVRSLMGDSNYYGQSNAEYACGRWENYMDNTRAERNMLYDTVTAAFNEATSGGAITVSAYRNGVLVGNASSTVVDTDSVSTGSGGGCHVIGAPYREPGDEIPSTRGNPWSTGRSQTVNFDNESITTNVRVPGVEAGDQIDFILHSGANFEMQNPMPRTPISMSSGGSGEFTIESGYIIIYQ